MIIDVVVVVVVIVVVVVVVVSRFILTLFFSGLLKCAVGWIWDFKGLGLRD